MFGSWSDLSLGAKDARLVRNRPFSLSLIGADVPPRPDGRSDVAGRQGDGGPGEDGGGGGADGRRGHLGERPALLGQPGETMLFSSGTHEETQHRWQL